MKRWTSINPYPEEARWKLLSEKLSQAGAINEYVPWSEPLENWYQAEALKTLDHVRLGTRVGSQIRGELKIQSSWVTLLGVIDGLVRRDGTWWPLCALYESFGRVLFDRGKELDFRGNVMVVGSGSVARVAIAAFFKAGFTQFLLANVDKAEAEALIKEIGRTLLGVKIEFVPAQGIVLLTGDTSALVNTTPLTQDNPLLEELSYLNFLRRPGFIFDMNLGKQAPSILMEAAKDSEIQIIPGSEIAARTDCLWAKWAFNADLDTRAYAKDLDTLLQSS